MLLDGVLDGGGFHLQQALRNAHGQGLALFTEFESECLAKAISGYYVLTLDRARALGELAEAQRRMIDVVPQRDYRKRRAEDIAPLSLPML